MGDRVTKEFFNRVSSTSSLVVVKQLAFEDGTLTSYPEEMRNIATRFYMELLSADPTTETVTQCRYEVWKSTQIKVTEHMQKRLALPLTIIELKRR